MVHASSQVTVYGVYKGDGPPILLGEWSAVYPSLLHRRCMVGVLPLVTMRSRHRGHLAAASPTESGPSYSRGKGAFYNVESFLLSFPEDEHASVLAELFLGDLLELWSGTALFRAAAEHLLLGSVPWTQGLFDLHRTTYIRVTTESRRHQDLDCAWHIVLDPWVVLSETEASFVRHHQGM